MARHLSAEWLEELSAAGSSAEVAESAGTLAVTIQQVVRGGDEGDVRFHLRVADGRVTATAGDAARPDITITEDRATATALARGDLSLQAAFMNGLVKVAGDPATLVEASGALAGVAAALAGVRANTTFDG